MSKSKLQAAQRAIVAALSQHAAYSYRASSAAVNQIHKEVDKLARALTASLAERLGDLTDAEMQAFVAGRYTTPRLRALKSEIDDWGKALGKTIRERWKVSAEQLARYESKYVADLMGNVLEGKKAPVGTAVILAQAARQPIMGDLVSDLLADIAPNVRKRIYSTIRQGLSEGQSNSQIIRALRGTPAMRYRDGLMQLARRDVERVVRTARNHVSNTAYEETYKALGVRYVVWTSTLEGRTCAACAAMDGKRFKIGESHQRPPVHPNCRCMLSPVLDDEVIGNRPYVRALKVKKRDGSYDFRGIGDMTQKQREEAGLKVGQVEAKTTFSSWFSNQDTEFQKQWLGPSRYKLYRDGDYSLERFVDPLGKQYTLSELRQRDAKTFKEIFGD